MWTRVAQGSLNGPNAFGRLSALTGRMTQALMESTQARMQIYTDDPCAVLKGTHRQIKQHIAVMALFGLALGWNLSFHIGRSGQCVDWIGFQFRILQDEVEVAIKACCFMKGFDRDVHRLLRQRRIQLGVLQSFTGRTNHVANLLYAWRPFISELWGAIA